MSHLESNPSLSYEEQDRLNAKIYDWVSAFENMSTGNTFPPVSAYTDEDLAFLKPVDGWQSPHLWTLILRLSRREGGEWLKKLGDLGVDVNDCPDNHGGECAWFVVFDDHLSNQSSAKALLFKEGLANVLVRERIVPHRWARPSDDEGDTQPKQGQSSLHYVLNNMRLSISKDPKWSDYRRFCMFLRRFPAHQDWQSYQDEMLKAAQGNDLPVVMFSIRLLIRRGFKVSERASAWVDLFHRKAYQLHHVFEQGGPERTMNGEDLVPRLWKVLLEDEALYEKRKLNQLTDGMEIKPTSSVLPKKRI